MASGLHGADLAHIYLQFKEKNVVFLRDFVVPALAAAGLEWRAFYGVPQKKAEDRNIFCQVYGSRARLMQEAERLKYKLELDMNKLRAADQKENRRLVEEDHFNFNPDGPDSEHMVDLTIPRASGVACVKGKDPYAFIYAPYVPSKNSLYYVHPTTGCFLSQSDALQLLKAIIEAPVDLQIRGAGLNLERLQHKKKIEGWWPGHDHTAREELERAWLGSGIFNPRLLSLAQPHDKIRNYFGERVAFYFSFAGFYALWLIVPALIGLGIFIDQVRRDTPSVSYLPIYGIFTAMWCTVFLEFWKRKQSGKAMKWGMTEFTATEPLRPAYTGSRSVHKVRSYVDGKPTFFSDPTLFRFKLTLSTSAIGTAVGIVVVVVGSIFWLRVILSQKEKSQGGSLPDGWGNYLTSLINAIQVQVMNVVYNAMARKLTAFENHPTQTAHDNSLILKLAVFYSINSYFGLVYVASIKNALIINHESQHCELNENGVPDCMKELQQQLAIMLLTRLVVSNLTGVILPWISQRLGFKLRLCCTRSAQARADAIALREATSEVEQEANKASYDTFEDYLEMLIRYGYITLFVAAFPLAPLLALFMAWIEARMDSHKVLRYTRRTMPKGAQDIGAWYLVFETISYLSVVSNLTIVVFTDQGRLFDRDWSYADRMTFFIVAEHIVFIIKYAISLYIPDKTYSTVLQTERQEYLVDKHIYDVKDSSKDEEDGTSAASAGSETSAAPSAVASKAFHIAESFDVMMGRAPPTVALGPAGNSTRAIPQAAQAAPHPPPVPNRNTTVSPLVDSRGTAV